MTQNCCDSSKSNCSNIKGREFCCKNPDLMLVPKDAMEAMLKVIHELSYQDLFHYPSTPYLSTVLFEAQQELDKFDPDWKAKVGSMLYKH